MEFFRKKESVRSNCIHTKKVYQVLDLENGDVDKIRIMKHIEGCSTCLCELKKLEGAKEAMHLFVPKPAIEIEMQDSIEREMGEFLGRLKFKDELEDRSIFSFFSKLFN